MSSDRLDGEEEERKRLASKIVPFGVAYLDDAMGGGMMATDVILLGAESGAGKTEMAVSVALQASSRGHKVCMLALEAGPREIERRVFYRLLVDEAFKAAKGGYPLNLIGLSYQRWFKGLCPDLDQFEKVAKDRAKHTLRNMVTLYRGRDFGEGQLQSVVASMKEWADLFILDHFHYLDTKDRDENLAQKKLIKTIRDLALDSGVPWVVVAHLRKKDSGFISRIVPEKDDFHGSSDLLKMSTAAIILSPAYDHNPPESWRFATYMCVVKNRMEGGVTRFVGLCIFSSRTNSYQDSYIVGKQTMGKVDGRQAWRFESCGGSPPDWAERHGGTNG